MTECRRSGRTCDVIFRGEDKYESGDVETSPTVCALGVSGFLVACLRRSGMATKLPLLATRQGPGRTRNDDT